MNYRRRKKKRCGNSARLLLCDQKKGLLNFTMTESINAKEEKIRETIYSVSDELDRHRERLNGLGFMIDGFLDTLRNNSPTEDLIVSLRFLFEDRFDREAELVEKMSKDLASIMEDPSPEVKS
ncbi:MAG: hypothetical protein IKG00_00065 [Lachnospiraceae bacterium]|nr:hypothetical protein [Lachnospiraceae bacterium]